MKALRLFIVHQFALGYEIRIGKFRARALRASRIIFPLGLITGIVLAVDQNPDALQWYDLVLISLFVISVLISFVYLKFWPIRFEECDDYQKYQMSLYPYHKLTSDQEREVSKLVDLHPEWIS